MVLVELLNLFSKYSGIVVKPILRYLGIKNKAAKTKANAEVTSQAMTIIPFLYDEPFNPTKCSVDRLVSNMEPAITTPVRLLPPRK